MHFRNTELIICFTAFCHWVALQGVKVKVTDRHGRKIESRYETPPPKLKAVLQLDGENVGFNLDQNQDLAENIPLYVLKVDSLGYHSLHHVSVNTNVTLYQDLENGATFGFIRKTSGSSSHYKSRGLLHKDGKVYELTSPVLSTEVITDDVLQTDIRQHSDGDDFSLRVHHDPSNLGPYCGLLTSVSQSEQNAAGRRHRRAVTQDVHVDIVALADYGVYKAWYGRSDGATEAEKRHNALDDLYEYYAFVYNGVNMMYKSITTLSYTIHMKLSAIVVATDGPSSPWTELGRQTRPGAEYDVTNASAALNNLTEWAGRHGSSLPRYDHLQLLTGYDLTNDEGNTVTTGLAWTATLCATNGSASSVIEDLGGFHCVNTAAHEIAHTLSANHDGFGNDCDSGDGYIMSSGLYTITDANKRNRWYWSNCSVRSMDDFFQDLSGTPEGRHCLYAEEAASGEVPDVSGRHPGQVYNVDQQCQQIHGANGSFCRGINIGAWSNICTAMWCLKPLTDNFCGREVAARGTTCGDKQWCIDGECVHDVAAPSTPDNCTLPDQPGPAVDGKTCLQLIQNPDNCNTNRVRIRCCKACATVHVPQHNDTSTTTAPVTSELLYDVDKQCQLRLGTESSMCRGIDIGDVSHICQSLWCLNPGSDGICSVMAAANETTCGDKQWCVNGTCFHDSLAPSVDDNCPFPDQPGWVANNMDCSQLVALRPRKCFQDYIRVRCCRHCAAAHIPVHDPSHTASHDLPGQRHNVDRQCQQIYGPDSTFCRGIKLNNVSEVCSSMWCLQLDSNNFCNPEVADDGTTCGDRMWCFKGQCIHDVQAPAVLDGCPFPDQPGAVSSGMTCAQLIASDASRHCSDSYVIARCCKACAVGRVASQGIAATASAGPTDPEVPASTTAGATTTAQPGHGHEHTPHPHG